MRRLMSVTGSMLLVSMLLTACATDRAVERSVSAVELTPEEAATVIARYENRRALRHQAVASDPLGQPKSMDDVLEILRKDQLDLFPEAMKFLKTQSSSQALAMQAQIELAWGEGQLILDEMLERSTSRLRSDVRALEQKKQAGGLSDAEKAQLEKLSKTANDVSGIGDALVTVGGQHINAGAALAEQLVATNPSDYHGYRVVADLYRLRKDWVKFDQAVHKLEQLNPNSNGLHFVRGMEALERNQDRAQAIKQFDLALEKDPKFARARVQRMLAETDLVAARDDLQKLASISPNHQIVAWVGPAIESHYQAFTEQQLIIEQQRNQRVIDATIRPGQ